MAFVQTSKGNGSHRNIRNYSSSVSKYVIHLTEKTLPLSLSFVKWRQEETNGTLLHADTIRVVVLTSL